MDGRREEAGVSTAGVGGPNLSVIEHVFTGSKLLAVYLIHMKKQAER